MIAKKAREFGAYDFVEKEWTDIQTALALLMPHFWPGNVRELDHCIERAAEWRTYNTDLCSIAL